MTSTAQADTFGALAVAARGPVIQPGDDGYDAARAVYNGMIDRRPAAVARCADVADVITAVRFAADSGLRVSVRGGGHNAGGLGVWDDALAIDLSGLRGIRVDPAARTARVDGGCVWGDVDHATGAFGLAVPSGFISTTGVGGLTLGGGIGYLSRQYGLTIDSLISADVVLADGTFVTASEQEHPDLFWALRGGGGNFGVVTSFEFRCHDVGNVVAGPVLYDIADASDVMRWYREMQPSLPENVSGWLGLLTIPPAPPFPEDLWLRKACAILWSYTGPAERADEVLAPVRGYGSPLLDAIMPMPFPVLQSIFDALYPAGLQWYWKADFFNEISDQAIAIHQQFGEALPTPHSTMHLYPIDGAVHRVSAESTAFAYRDAGWAGVIVGVDPDPANAAKIKDWAVRYWEALHPTSAGGGYMNFMMDEGNAGVRAAYGGNYDRLARIKAAYDPGNFFRINQNVTPAG